MNHLVFNLITIQRGWQYSPLRRKWTVEGMAAGLPQMLQPFAKWGSWTKLLSQTRGGETPGKTNTPQEKLSWCSYSDFPIERLHPDVWHQPDVPSLPIWRKSLKKATRETCRPPPLREKAMPAMFTEKPQATSVWWHAATCLLELSVLVVMIFFPFKNNQRLCTHAVSSWGWK